MTVQYKTKTINGQVYGINTLPSGLSTGDAKGLHVLTWVLSLIGEPIGRIGPDAFAGGGVSRDGIVRAVAAVMTKLADPATVKNVGILLSGLDVGGKKVDLDLHFAANYGELAAVVTWALEENFSSFFDGNPLLSALERVGPRAPNPQTSTG